MTDLVCIICPRSCKMLVHYVDGKITVSGNHCKRGHQFAVNELTEPKRTLSSTVKTVFPQAVMLPVRISGEIPKEKIFEVMRELANTVVTEPIGRGDIVIKNVLSLGVNVIATSNILIEINAE